MTCTTLRFWFVRFSACLALLPGLSCAGAEFSSVSSGTEVGLVAVDGAVTGSPLSVSLEAGDASSNEASSWPPDRDSPPGSGSDGASFEDAEPPFDAPRCLTDAFFAAHCTDPYSWNLVCRHVCAWCPAKQMNLCL